MIDFLAISNMWLIASLFMEEPKTRIAMVLLGVVWMIRAFL